MTRARDLQQAHGEPRAATALAAALVSMALGGHAAADDGLIVIEQSRTISLQWQDCFKWPDGCEEPGNESTTAPDTGPFEAAIGDGSRIATQESTITRTSIVARGTTRASGVYRLECGPDRWDQSTSESVCSVVFMLEEPTTFRLVGQCVSTPFGGDARVSLIGPGTDLVRTALIDEGGTLEPGTYTLEIKGEADANGWYEVNEGAGTFDVEFSIGTAPIELPAGSVTLLDALRSTSYAVVANQEPCKPWIPLCGSCIDQMSCERFGPFAETVVRCFGGTTWYATQDSSIESTEIVASGIGRVRSFSFCGSSADDETAISSLSTSFDVTETRLALVEMAVTNGATISFPPYFEQFLAGSELVAMRRESVILTPGTYAIEAQCRAAAETSHLYDWMWLGEEFHLRVRFFALLDGPDFDGDGIVGSVDLGLLLGAWGPCGRGACPADLDHDGSVGGRDLGLLLGAWSAP